MIFVYLGCFLVLLYYFLTKNNSYWQSKGVPFDKLRLLFGSLFKTVTGRENISEIFSKIYKQHDSPYVGFFIFNSPNLMLRSPEIIKKVLVKDFDKFANRQGAINESRDPLSFHSLNVARDATWKNLRTKISPIFTSGKMKLMHSLMKECGESMKTYLEERSGSCIEMSDVVKRYSVDVISSCAFGVNSNCFRYESTDMLDAARKLLDPTSFVRSFSLFCFFFAPKLMDLFRLTLTDASASNYLVDVFKKMYKERTEKGVLRNDLLNLLNNLKKNENINDDYKFDDTKMASQAILFFTAGNDTTSLTLTFAVYELAMNREIQERLRDEIRETYEKENNFTYESIMGMKYLDMFLNETLRKYPLANFLNREAKDDYTFEETGVTIDKGTGVYIPIVGLHFDSEYFPNPEKFDPERFSDQNKENIKPYTYLPFGDGPRICIGQRFAQLSSKTALAYLLKDFVVEPTEKTYKKMEYVKHSPLIQPKNGVHVKVTKI